MWNSIVTLVLTVFLAEAVLAADPHLHAAQPGPTESEPSAAPVLALSPALRGALVAEMVGLRQRVGELAAQLSTGEWQQVANNARQVRDSYIMKQQLSVAQLEELERALPAEFVALDVRFHDHAEGLAHAALAQDGDLALFYYGKMLEGCQGCHSQYATHTLTGFRQPVAEAHHH